MSAMNEASLCGRNTPDTLKIATAREMSCK